MYGKLYKTSEYCLFICHSSVIEFLQLVAANKFHRGVFFNAHIKPFSVLKGVIYIFHRYVEKNCNILDCTPNKIIEFIHKKEGRFVLLPVLSL